MTKSSAPLAKSNGLIIFYNIQLILFASNSLLIYICLKNDCCGALSQQLPRLAMHFSTVYLLTRF